jgi:hypothetical protein
MRRFDVMVRRIGALGLLLLAGAWIAPLQAAPPGFGKLSGVVVDPAGVPQMGASVSVMAEGLRGSVSTQLLTNDRGVFAADQLRPGLYSVRVTLAGFLPALERHVRVDSSLTTILKIELDSLFASFSQLRRKPNQQETEPDEWMWVLRTSAQTRPVLRWVDGTVVLESEPLERSPKARPHGRVELTAGARRPGSVSNLPDAPSSAFVYEQRVGPTGRLLLAGQSSFESSASAGIAATWNMSGELGRGMETTLVLRQSMLGPGGPRFRGVRVETHDQLSVGRFSIRYGAEYVLVGLGRNASSLRPQGEIVYQISPKWRAGLTVASRPWSGVEPRSNALEQTLNQLDAFPALLVRDGRPVLAGGWHEEISIEHLLGPNTSLLTSVFRDRSRNTAVFGRGSSSDPDFFQDFFSGAFAYDGGNLNSWGTRVAYRQKLSDGTEVTFVYAYAGALFPSDLPPSLALRDRLEGHAAHSFATRVSTRIPWSGTSVSASYKWVSGSPVSRQDPFGEIAYQLDPHMNISVRQPIPTNIFPGKLEALADFRNLMAQGYVPVSTSDGQVVLVPSFRSFRGGFSLQF